ncbi:GrpB family protein [Streptomyces sp. NPDC055239]
MLLFRDRLRKHSGDRKLYGDTKRFLAQQTWEYVQNYADAKSQVVAGILERRRPRTPQEHDAYQVFHQRSLLIGWLDDRAGTAEGDDPLNAPGSDLISWFQVEASAVAGDRPLPVQPFLRCAEDTTARTGTVRLTAVQVLLPVQGLDASSRPPYGDLAVHADDRLVR